MICDDFKDFTDIELSIYIIWYTFSIHNVKSGQEPFCRQNFPEFLFRSREAYQRYFPKNFCLIHNFHKFLFIFILFLKN